MKWILILLIQGYQGYGVTTIEVDSEPQCSRIGEQWVGYNARSKSYQCIEKGGE